MRKSTNDRHRLLMRKLLAGMTLTQAAFECGYNYQSACDIVNSPSFKQEMEEMREQLKKDFIEAEATEEIKRRKIRSRIEELADRAVDALSQALSDESGRVKVSAAKEILDRSGFKAETETSMNLYVQPTPGLIEALRTLRNGNSNEKRPHED